MAISVTAQPANVPPRVQITISGLSDSTTTITRLDPDGRVRAVRAAEPATLVAGAWQGFDYEMPLGVPVTYTSTPPLNAVETSTAATVTVTDGWLVHPGVPDLSVRLPQANVTQLEERTRAARSAVLQPLGRATPIVVNETRSGVQSGLTLLTETLDAAADVLAAVSSGAPMLLNFPPTWGWGVTWEYISIGDVTEGFVAKGLSAARLFTLPYTVVDRPVGSLTAQWTWAGVVAQYATWADVTAAFDTWTKLVANEPN